ncbi:hypothetical protein F4556_005167 [Kitasatospora gansuensis]|uniref:Uncharacterized protein n=1 Tax=Kitasatospora gansuensis TaxID=258050 RepID=A0A7W7WJ97_9ACTN|nr:hypothetical protein [Kitasatospora gansuensis]MBB4949632.1 hypothetical protein [Kitasatospora gansuensis]
MSLTDRRPTAPLPEEHERLAELLAVTSPTHRAHAGQLQTVPVLDALRPLLPAGALVPGQVVQSTDPGLRLALVAGMHAADEHGADWLAILNGVDVGLAALAGLGAELDRILLVDRAGAATAEVISALAPAVPLILVEGDDAPDPVLARRLTALLRRHHCTLVTAAPWPGQHLRLDVVDPVWHGIGDGHGQITGRDITVLVSGRGSAGAGSAHRLALPTEDGRVVHLGRAQARTGLRDDLARSL